MSRPPMNIFKKLNFSFLTVTSALSLSNIQGVLGNTTSSITTGVSDVGNSILETIVEKKQNLNDALENFDSQEMFHQGAEKINSAVNAKHKGLEYVGKKLGLFEAVDNIAKFKAALPNHIGIMKGQLNSEKDVKDSTSDEEVMEKVVGTQNSDVLGASI